MLVNPSMTLTRTVLQDDAAPAHLVTSMVLLLGPCVIVFTFIQLKDLLTYLPPTSEERCES